MLPIRKVVLFKHGIGYFEREGVVEGDAAVELHFKADEMNDVLKSLTTLDLDRGLVASISYESARPVEKQLEDIAIRLPDKNALSGLLAQVKGARVALEAGARRVEGAVLGTESVPRKAGDGIVETQYVTLLVDQSSVQSFDLTEVKSLGFLDEALRKDLQHLLDALISAKKKNLKKLTIFGRGSGRRRLVVSYAVAAPVWKASYRILLRENTALAQGWALVDNTQDEDWEDVSLTLVAGLPVSFVHDLYSPRYKKRPEVMVREEEAYAPPVLEAATRDVERMMLSARASRARDIAAGAASLEIADTLSGPDVDVGAIRAAARERSVQVQTRTVEVGDLFQYEIRNPVSVRRNQSALVPILQESFDGRRVAVYNPEVREKNPMTALQFRNSTGMTLEGGPLTVLEDEHYVGESMLETMKPGEERLVPYSVELGCTVTLDDKSEQRAVHFARVAGGKLHLHRYRLRRKIYVLRNQTERKLDLFLEHRFAPGWDLVETPAPVEKTEHFHRFRFDVAPRQTTEFVVTEKGEETEAYALHTARSDQLGLWLESRYIDRKTCDVLEECARVYEKAAALVRQVQEREKELGELVQDQERLRKNLQALGSSQDEKSLRERYVADLSRGEDRLAEGRAEVKRMRTEKDALEEQLRMRLGQLKFEANV